MNSAICRFLAQVGTVDTQQQREELFGAAADANGSASAPTPAPAAAAAEQKAVKSE
jgi:hypothetical protein